MTGSVNTTRQLQSWIDGFVEYSSELPAPIEFRKWGAIATLAGALERRVFIKTATGLLYPNMFLMLVAPPAVGKSVIINEVNNFWKSAGVLHIAPKSATKEGFLDFLADSASTLNTGAKVFEVYHAALVPASEFGNFVPQHDTAWLNVLNELYDCTDDFTTQTRGKGVLKIKNTCMTMLSGSQPQFLADLLPETAFGMGFTSRLLMIYAGQKVKVSIFNTNPTNAKLYQELKKDLSEIASIAGEFDLSDEALHYLEALHDDDIPPTPTHPKLQNYNGRRLLHLLKLSMVFSISEDSNLHIDKTHVEKALEYLVDVESDMPQIFKEMSVGSHGQVLEEAYQFLQHEFIRAKNPIPEVQLRRFLDRRVPVNQINYYIVALIEGQHAELIKPKGDKGPRFFRPISILNEGRTQ